MERELEAELPAGTRGPLYDPLLAALADLVARAVRVWLVEAKPTA